MEKTVPISWKRIILASIVALALLAAPASALSSWYVALALIGAANSAVAEEPPAVPLDVIHPEIYVGPEGWGGMQSIQADAEGSVFLFRSQTLEVYPVDAGELGEPRKLEPRGSHQPVGLFSASMGSEPDSWLAVGHDLYWFDEGEPEEIDKPNQPLLSVLLVDDTPVALLGPFELWTQRRSRGPDDLPTLSEWTGTDWDPLLEESVEDLEDPSSLQGDYARAAFLAGDDRDIWVAQLYESRLRRIGPTGTVLLEIRAEMILDDLALDSARSEEIRQKLQDAADRRGKPAEQQVVSTKVQVVDRRPAHHGLTVSRDGTVYVVATDPEHPDDRRLRRWDPVRGVLEETALAYDLTGLGTLAVGREGLHLAQYNARRGRAFIPNQVLEDARWRPVEGITIDGLDASVPDAAPSKIPTE